MSVFKYNPSVWRKIGLAAGLDLILVILAYYLILAFRFEGSIPSGMHLGSSHLSIFLSAAIVLHIGLNGAFHVYSIVNRYVGLSQALWIIYASLTSTCALVLVDLFWPGADGRLVPLSVVIVGGAFAAVAMIAIRFYSRVFQALSLSPVRDARRVLVVGAGAAAEAIVREVGRTPGAGMRIIGLVDDDPRLQRMRIHRYSILGSIDDVPKLAERHSVDEFLIAIPSAGPAELERIYSILRPMGRPIKTVPPLSQLIDGQVSVQDVRELRIEDLLGRDPVRTDLAAVAGYVKGRRVLVTGAAGSIGSELCRQIVSFEPESLILVDRNESGLYDLHEELRVRGFRRYSLVPTHIQQRLKIRTIFGRYRPQVVFHAAAFKHVPLMESFPDEAVLNNVRGTLILAEEAGSAGVERFINISTDKAADPVSAMGASKAVAELVVRSVGERFPETQYCSVRFGNVLGSRGSVVPIFQRQIESGGPVTVTHEEMTRYFMSIAEAVQLVLQAASMAGDPGYQGGTFILDMGEPVRIVDVAHQMIAFSGNGHTDAIRIVFTGMRPGERMHELLVGSEEQSAPTAHPQVAILTRRQPGGCRPNQSEAECFRENLEALMALGESHADRDAVIEAFRAIVPTYEPFSIQRTAGFEPFVAVNDDRDVFGEKTLRDSA